MLKVNKKVVGVMMALAHPGFAITRSTIPNKNNASLSLKDDLHNFYKTARFFATNPNLKKKSYDDRLNEYACNEKDHLHMTIGKDEDITYTQKPQTISFDEWRLLNHRCITIDGMRKFINQPNYNVCFWCYYAKSFMAFY